MNSIFNSEDSDVYTKRRTVKGVGGIIILKLLIMRLPFSKPKFVEKDCFFLIRRFVNKQRLKLDEFTLLRYRNKF